MTAVRENTQEILLHFANRCVKSNNVQSFYFTHGTRKNFSNKKLTYNISAIFFS